MLGQRHLIECHCVLPLYKDRRPIVYHKFPVYSKFNTKTSKVIPKYANCNNCGITHLIDELCKSQIKIGKEDIKSARSISEVTLSLPIKIVDFLKDYNSSISLYEEIEDIFDNLTFPKDLIIKREIIDEQYHVKVLKLISQEKYKIVSEIIDNTIIGE